jgi:hypothetical protein
MYKGGLERGYGAAIITNILNYYKVWIVRQNVDARGKVKKPTLSQKIRPTVFSVVVFDIKEVFSGLLFQSVAVLKS